MEELIIGSQALKVAGSQYISKAKRHWDLDIICTLNKYEHHRKKLQKNLKKEFKVNRDKVFVIQTEKQNYEFDIAWENSTNESLLKIVDEDKSLVNIVKRKAYASPNLIYTLKMSHRYLKNSPHFLKTMIDIKHLRSVGCVIPDSLQTWYKERMKETYWYKHPSLKVDKENFFKIKEESFYVYDHDTIHQSVKLYDKPAYEYFKSDNAEVMCDKNLFFACDEKIRLAAGYEESCVLGIERSAVPAPGIWDSKKIYHYALSKVCTSITSGYFREYCWENFFKISSMYNPNYINKFWHDVESGLVKKL